MNPEKQQIEIQQPIIPESLSDRDTAFTYLLAKEMIVQKIQQQYLLDMKAKETELKRLQQKLDKKPSIDLMYVSTKHAAAFIGVDSSYLTKRQGKAFKLGTHFFKPKGESIVRWKLTALSAWISKGQDSSESITPKLAKLLERR